MLEKCCVTCGEAELQYDLRGRGRQRHVARPRGSVGAEPEDRALAPAPALHDVRGRGPNNRHMGNYNKTHNNNNNNNADQ